MRFYRLLVVDWLILPVVCSNNFLNLHLYEYVLLLSLSLCFISRIFISCLKRKKFLLAFSNYCF